MYLNGTEKISLVLLTHLSYVINPPMIGTCNFSTIGNCNNLFISFIIIICVSTDFKKDMLLNPALQNTSRLYIN